MSTGWWGKNWHKLVRQVLHFLHLWIVMAYLPCSMICLRWFHADWVDSVWYWESLFLRYQLERVWERCIPGSENQLHGQSTSKTCIWTRILNYDYELEIWSVFIFRIGKPITSVSTNWTKRLLLLSYSSLLPNTQAYYIEICPNKTDGLNWLKCINKIHSIFCG